MAASESGAAAPGAAGRSCRNHGRKTTCQWSSIRTADEASSTNCGRLDTLSPAKLSTLTTLSMVNRSTDCAAAGAAHSSTSAALHVRRNDHIAGLGNDAGERAGERGDDFGVEFGAGAAPQLLHGVRRWPRPAVRPRRGHRIVRVGDVHDARGQRDVVAPEALRIAAAVGALV